jgi:hypothetical protein
VQIISKVALKVESLDISRGITVAIKGACEYLNQRSAEDTSAWQGWVQIDVRTENKMSVPENARLPEENQLFGRVNSIGAVRRFLSHQPVNSRLGDDLLLNLFCILNYG